MSNKRMLIVGGVLLAIIIICMVILANVYVEREAEIPEDVRAMIETSEWPIQQIPVLNKPNLKVKKYNQNIQMQEIDKGVTFDEYKAYLFELADAGFEADTSMGCKHPSMINSNMTEENTDEFTWLAVGNGYYITVAWVKEDTDEVISNFYVELSKLRSAGE